MSDKEYNTRLKQIKAMNLTKQRKQNLKAEKRKYKKPVKLPTTSKLILLAVVLINIQIIWFVEKAMIQWGDFSAAYALIGIPATLIPTVWGYYSKSKAENTSGGIVYDMAMVQAQSQAQAQAQAQTESPEFVDVENQDNSAKG